MIKKEKTLVHEFDRVSLALSFFIARLFHQLAALIIYMDIWLIVTSYKEQRITIFWREKRPQFV